jgi:hypothetical protein
MNDESQALAVHLGADISTASLHRVVLASLPVHFHASDESTSDVVVVPTASADWPMLLKRIIERGARGALVAGTGRSRPDMIRAAARLARSAGSVVVVDTGYWADATWARARSEMGADTGRWVVVDSVITIGRETSAGSAVSATPLSRLFAGLVAQIGAIRTVVPPDWLVTSHLTDGHYAVWGSSGETAVNLVGILAPNAPSELSIDLVSVPRRWQARFHHDALATPTEVMCLDEDLGLTLPRVFESAHRRAWLDLHGAITQGSTAGYPLEELARDMELALALTTGRRWPAVPDPLYPWS